MSITKVDGISGGPISNSVRAWAVRRALGGMNGPRAGIADAPDDDTGVTGSSFFGLTRIEVDLELRSRPDCAHS